MYFCHECERLYVDDIVSEDTALCTTCGGPFIEIATHANMADLLQLARGRVISVTQYGAGDVGFVNGQHVMGSVLGMLFDTLQWHHPFGSAMASHSTEQGMSESQAREFLSRLQVLNNETSTSGEEAKICGICHDTDTEDNDVLVALPCSHCYHMNCIKKWITVKAQCPVCRNLIAAPQSGASEQ
ncbi:Ring finger domain [Trypanosoma vivax]|uniref:RING-type domain-containing protein n=1 Tax=Trypanosoma vivax (strain Y486) TaxID=1055687 RepID=G0U576_TRYVY|nr:hypothetical protein TRVL_06819 [Trypanosoma vivax]KAH8616603.1 Ring finger domain [Trypanosoma vivax]CCC51024.1 hypothetical protein TVY486_1000780 [Trypanosoma vivax Y486]